MPDDNSSLPKRDFRQEVTDNIIRMLEQGTAPWQKPWDAGKLEMPNNPTTDKPYRGGNAVHLMTVAAMKEYDDPRWLTYKQAAENGWQVRKGEKGTQIEYWEFPDSAKTPKQRGTENEEQLDADSKSAAGSGRIVHRVYTVFNAQQIEGIPPHPPKQRPEFEVVESGERILRHSGATIRHDQNDRAFYNRQTDSIHLPSQAAFKSAGDYYGTALHELAHWTGNPSRLNRSTLNESYRFGDPNYAQEELRAELASVFLAAERGIPHNPEQHAAYVGSWITALRNDKNEIFRAAKDANRAADFLIALEQEKSIERPDAAVSVPEPPAATVQTADGQTNTDRFQPGDKIVAFEPFYYGGKPKREPEVPGVVQSVYAEGKFVSYIRIAGDGQIRENGNKPIDDRGLRLADRVDLDQFRDKFSRLEAEYQKRTGQVVTARQEQDITGQKALSNDPPPPPTGSLRHSFAQALQASKTIIGDQAKLYEAETLRGNYRGEIIARTDLHVVQRLNDSSAVAHMTHMLSPIPRVGERVQVQYAEKDFARVREIRERSRAKDNLTKPGLPGKEGQAPEIAKESSRFVARFEPGSGTVGVHDKRFENDHHSTIDPSQTDKVNGNNEKRSSELKESFQEARALAVKELGQEAKTYVAQTHSGVYYGKIIGETEHHLVQRVSSQTAVAHLKKLVAETPRIDTNVSISYPDDKAWVRNLPERSRAAEIAR